MLEGERKRPGMRGLTGSLGPSGGLRIAAVLLLSALIGCSAPPKPGPAAPPREETAIHIREIERPKEPENAAPYRAILPNGAVLYLPPTFAVRRGGYDLLIHFHGESRWQEQNIERAKLDVAVVSVNLGMGTDSYANPFRSPDAFDRLLATIQAGVAKSGRADGAVPRRIALSAWSAGFSSIGRLMSEQVTERVDAVILADGFFTSFSDPKRRTVNVQGLERFVHFAQAAERDEKLFAITHTTIPTGPYPSVQECVARLLELLDLEKSPAPGTGPRDLHSLYAVDVGGFHVHGFEGTQASDHVKQLQAMGETMYPLLKARWDRQDGVALRR